jgi:hypothetical protein
MDKKNADKLEPLDYFELRAADEALARLQVETELLTVSSGLRAKLDEAAATLAAVRARIAEEYSDVAANEPVRLDVARGTLTRAPKICIVDQGDRRNPAAEA